MLKIIELFAGIGACSSALKRLGIEHEIVDAVEIDKYAIASFNAIHNTNFQIQDVCEWDKDIEVDLIMHGSPCQDFSVAGKQAGGDIGSGTRSSLMYETVRIVGKLRPKYVIWENVKNVLSKKHIHNFDNYLTAMQSLGYTNYYEVLNAKDYGIPQNRERVFVVSIFGNKHYEFPSKKTLRLKLKDLLENKVDEKYYLSQKMIDFFIKNEQIQKEKGNGFRFGVSDGNVIAKAVTTRAGGRMDDNFIDEGKYLETKSAYFRTFGSKGKLQDSEKCVDTLQAAMGCGGGNVPLVKARSSYRIRKLTPKECWRLMGFDDEEFEKAEKVNSNTQLYKQAGNSIVVNVLEAIFRQLFDMKNE